jgi:hypothetical protein
MIYDPIDEWAFWYAKRNFDVTFQRWYWVVYKQMLWRLGFQLGVGNDHL